MPHGVAGRACRLPEEICFDIRTVLEHPLSLVTEGFHEAGRERQFSRCQSEHPYMADRGRDPINAAVDTGHSRARLPDTQCQIESRLLHVSVLCVFWISPSPPCPCGECVF